MEMIVNDPFYSSFSPPHNPVFNIPELLWGNSGNEVRTGFEDPLNHATMVTFDENLHVEEEKKIVQTLSRETLSDMEFIDWNFQPEFSICEAVLHDVPLMEMIVNDPFYSSFSPPHNPAFNIPELLWGNSTNNAAMVTFDENLHVEKEKKIVKRSRKIVQTLSRETISQYFYMSIQQAAKEFNVGVTLFKERCRELGIRRWLYRKLRSLQTLIKNVQEFGKEEGDEKLRELQKLEQEMKLMEEIPYMQLEEKTKTLRMKFFKLNYMKRKLGKKTNSL